MLGLFGQVNMPISTVKTSQRYYTINPSGDWERSRFGETNCLVLEDDLLLLNGALDDSESPNLG